MFSFKSIALAAVAALGLASQAAAVGLNPANIGGERVWTEIEGDSSRIAGLFGVTNASVGDVIDLATVQGLQISGPAIANIYVGDPTNRPPAGFDGGFWVGSPQEFTLANDGIEIGALSNASSLFDSLWIEFVNFSGNAVFQNGAGTATFGLGLKSVFVDYEAPKPIPLPAALPLLAAGFGMLVLVRRRRATA
jgi:hypothetical protein